MKKTVLLTGASGRMGLEGLKQLYENKDKFNIVLFSLPSKEDKKILEPYINDEDIKMVWGDLTNYEDVKRAVQDAQIVLHVGALVSPIADSQPELAWKINYEGTKNIVDAILEREDSDNVKLLYVGTVAETGNRPSPVHWGRVGDPIIPSVYDYYSLSKIAAERYIIESKLKHWVSVRQTGILHKRLVYVNDGTGYHQPLNTHMEWVTVEDSGRLLLNACMDDVPEEFWNNVYNVGGGKNCRLSAYEFYERMFYAMGLKLREVFSPNMFALRNFHGQYFLDSDKLNDYLHFRTQDVDDVIKHIKDNLPLAMRVIKYLPKKMIKRIMKRQSEKNPITPLYWIKFNVTDKIKAYFGSRKNWEQIGGWESFEHKVDPPHIVLNHGYDESKQPDEITLEDIKLAAEFRGGKCLSKTMTAGDLHTKLEFECSLEHTFMASPYLILKTGHWCPECVNLPWNFDEQAKKNKFIAQVWHHDHDANENITYN